MEPPKQVKMYDPVFGGQYLSVAEAARYLDYDEFSVRRLICRGALKPHGKVGNKWMFLRVELDRYKSANPWAARKAGISRIKDLPPPPPSGLRAEVRVDMSFGSAFTYPLEIIEEFEWKQLPLIRAKIHNAHGDVPFSVDIKGPDGASWRVDYQPPTWFEKAWKKVTGK